MDSVKQISLKQLQLLNYELLQPIITNHHGTLLVHLI